MKRPFGGCVFGVMYVSQSIFQITSCKDVRHAQGPRKPEVYKINRQTGEKKGTCDSLLYVSGGYFGGNFAHSLRRLKHDAAP